MRTLFTIFIVCIFTLLFVNAVSAQWVQTNGPYGGSVLSIAISGNGYLFAGTDGHGMFCSTDDGMSWSPVNNGLENASVTALAVIPRLGGPSLFAGIDYVGVFRSTDNGTSWTAVNNGLPPINYWHQVNTFAVIMNENGDTSLFAGFGNEGVYCTTNNGTSWTAVNNGLLHKDVYVLAVITNENGTSSLFAGTNGGVFRSTDNGSSWTEVNHGLQYAVIRCLAVVPDGSGGKYLFAGTDGGGIYRSADNGDNWTGVNSGLGNNFVTSFVVSGTTLFAGTIGSGVNYWDYRVGGIYVSSNYGASWSPASNGLFHKNITALASGNYLLAGTLGGGVFRSTDKGANWNDVNNGLMYRDIGALTVCVNESGDKDILAGTFNGGVFRSADNGKNWIVIKNSPASSNISAFAFNPNKNGGINLFAATEGTFVYRSKDRGITWTQVFNGMTNAVVHALAVKPNSTGGTDLFAGTEGGVFLLPDNATKWSGVNNGLTNQSVHALIACHDGTGGTNLFAGTDEGVFLLTNDATSWNAVNNGIPWYNRGILALIATPNGIGGVNLFAGTEYYGVFRSTDNGASWHEVNNGLPYYLSMRAFASTGINLFVGTYGGGVFLSSDNGDSWRDVNTGMRQAAVKSLIVCGAELFAGTDRSGVLRRPLAEMVVSPIITSVKDLPDDQGERVSLRWIATHLDTNTATLPYYSIWRSIPEVPNQALSATDHSSPLKSPNYRTTVINGDVYAWEWIANQPAHRFARYSYTVPTLRDSTLTSNAMQYFLVSAQTNEANVFYDSNIDSGYSVDNLPPIAPRNLVYAIRSDSVVLQWHSNTEPDLHGYVIYRCADSIAHPATSEYYATAIDTFFIDSSPTQSARYFIRAQDIHGNYSEASNEIQVVITGIAGDGNELPVTYSLSQNYPNPFNPITTINYQLPTQSRVTLKIFDVLGKEVAILVNGVEEPGYKTVNFNASKLASGVYYCRLVAGTFIEVKKMALLR
jgi:photosystem II stability/assembly factor-like uncharacterized protein